MYSLLIITKKGDANKVYSVIALNELSLFDLHQLLLLCNEYSTSHISNLSKLSPIKRVASPSNDVRTPLIKKLNRKVRR